MLILGNDVYGTNSYHLDDDVHPLEPGEIFEVVPGPEPYFVGRAYLPVTLRFEKWMPKDRPLPS